METTQTPKKSKKARIVLLIVLLLIAALAVAAVLFLPKFLKEKDSDSSSHSQKDVFRSAKVGDKITFGEYEQDNDLENGAEPIEWIVMEKDEDGNLLLASKYILDNRVFSDDPDSPAWVDSSLRKWLNSTFYNAAFSKEEQKVIHTFSYTTHGRLSDEVNERNDNVLLLTVAQIYDHFDSNELYEKDWVKATPYAIAQGLTCPVESYGEWWCLSWSENPTTSNSDQVVKSYISASCELVAYNAPVETTATVKTEPTLYPTAMTVEKFDEIIGQLDSSEQLRMKKYYALVDMESLKDKPQEKKTVENMYAKADRLGQFRVLKTSPSAIEKKNITAYLEKVGFTMEDKEKQEKAVGYTDPADLGPSFVIAAPYSDYEKLLPSCNESFGVRPAIWVDPYATTKNKR